MVDYSKAERDKLRKLFDEADEKDAAPQQASSSSGLPKELQGLSAADLKAIAQRYVEEKKGAGATPHSRNSFNSPISVDVTTESEASSEEVKPARSKPSKKKAAASSSTGPLAKYKNLVPPLAKTSKRKDAFAAANTRAPPKTKLVQFGLHGQLMILPIGEEAVKHNLDGTPNTLDLTDLGLKALKLTASDLELFIYPSIPEGTTGTGVQNIIVTSAKGKYDLLGKDGNYKYYKLDSSGARILIKIARSHDLDALAVKKQYPTQSAPIIVLDRPAPDVARFWKRYHEHRQALLDQRKIKKKAKTRAVSSDDEESEAKDARAEREESTNSYDKLASDSKAKRCSICKLPIHKSLYYSHWLQCESDDSKPTQERVDKPLFLPRSPSDAKEEFRSPSPSEKKPPLPHASGLSGAEGDDQFSDFHFSPAKLRKSSAMSHPPGSPSKSRRTAGGKKPTPPNQEVIEISDSSDDEMDLDMKRQNEEREKVLAPKREPSTPFMTAEEGASTTTTPPDIQSPTTNNDLPSASQASSLSVSRTTAALNLNAGVRDSTSPTPLLENSPSLERLHSVIPSVNLSNAATTVSFRHNGSRGRRLRQNSATSSERRPTPQVSDAKASSPDTIAEPLTTRVGRVLRPSMRARGQ